MSGRCWTDEEDAKLALLWNSDLTLEEIHSVFIDRTKISLQVRAKRLGLRHTPEQFKRILSKKVSGDRNGMYGRTGPRKGVILSKEQKALLSARAMEGYVSGTRIPMKGAANPRFGKPGTMLGKKMPDSAKEALSLMAHERWVTRTETEKAATLSAMRMGWIKWATLRRPTKIELQVSIWLQEIDINYISQVAIDLFVVDFLVKDNLVIETFGDYWHGNPEVYSIFDKTQRSNIRAKMVRLTNRGFKILVLWERDIKLNPQKCLEVLREFVT